MSNLPFQSLITTVPRHIRNELEKIEKTFVELTKKTDRGKKNLHNCNRYSTSTENIENEKSCFSISDNNCPKAYQK